MGVHHYRPINLSYNSSAYAFNLYKQTQVKHAAKWSPIPTQGVMPLTGVRQLTKQWLVRSSDGYT